METPEPKPKPPTPPDTPEETKEENNSKTWLWATLGSVGGLAVIVGLVFLFIYRRQVMVILKGGWDNYVKWKGWGDSTARHFYEKYYGLQKSRKKFPRYFYRKDYNFQELKQEFPDDWWKAYVEMDEDELAKLDPSSEEFEEVLFKLSKERGKAAELVNPSCGKSQIKDDPNIKKCYELIDKWNNVVGAFSDFLCKKHMNFILDLFNGVKSLESYLVLGGKGTSDEKLLVNLGFDKSVSFKLFAYCFGIICAEREVLLRIQDEQKFKEFSQYVTAFNYLNDVIDERCFGSGYNIYHVIVTNVMYVSLCSKNLNKDVKEHMKKIFVEWFTKNKGFITSSTEKLRGKLKDKEAEAPLLEKDEAFRSVLMAGANLEQIETFIKTLDGLMQNGADAEKIEQFGKLYAKFVQDNTKEDDIKKFYENFLQEKKIIKNIENFDLLFGEN